MIAALVPAAGSSTRLGQPKLLLEFHGQTLIGRLVRSLREGGASRVVVVAPPAEATEGPAVASEALRAGAEVVVPKMRPLHMRDSIELGLDTLALGEPVRCVVLTPGDCVGVTAGIVDQLVKRAVAMPDRLVIPSHNGKRGHPIVLPWPVAAQIHALPPGVGVNALVARHAGSVVEIEVANPEILADLDTPADLQQWREREPRHDQTAHSGFHVNVRLFALAKERAGRPEVEIELSPGSTVGDLRRTLVDVLPSLAAVLSNVMIAVNEEYAGDSVTIVPGSRLAVIPPVSGGAGEGR